MPSGSNNWVIAGQHTASGKPLLSNDMHLSLTVPNIWYMADLRAPGYHAAGVTLPGFPSSSPATMNTSPGDSLRSMADVQDLYVEKLDGKGNLPGCGRKMEATVVPITRSSTCAAAKTSLSRCSLRVTVRC